MRREVFALGLGAFITAAPARAIEPDEPPSAQPPPPQPAASPADTAPAPAPAPPTAPAPPAAPGPAPPPLEPPPDAYAPGAGSPTSAPPQMAGPEEDADDGGEGRFRGGVGGLLGAFFPGGVWQFGPEGRLGYQIDDMMAVYASFGAHAGFRVASDDEGNSSLNVGAGVFVSPMFEITLADIFFAGIGPQILYGTFASLDTVISETEVGASAGVFAGLLPGFKIKTGVGFGSDEPDRRKQFTLALDLSVVFGERYVVTDTGSAESGIAVGVLPMLAVGYDAK